MKNDPSCRFSDMERSMMKLEGYVEHIIYRNTDNGYSVLNLVSDEEEITVVGIFHYISEGEFLELEGEYTEHPLYGQQFHMERFEEKTPKDAMAIERYLGSGAIKGIGAALAARIVRRFGARTLDIMEREPERLAEIKGISERKARENRGADGGKERSAPGHDVSSGIWNFHESGGEDLPSSTVRKSTIL